MIAEKLRKSILQAAVQGKLTEQLPEDGDARELLKKILRIKNPSREVEINNENSILEIIEDDVPFDIPGNWCWVRLSSLSKKIIAGGDKPRIIWI